MADIKHLEPHHQLQTDAIKRVQSAPPNIAEAQAHHQSTRLVGNNDKKKIANMVPGKPNNEQFEAGRGMRMVRLPVTGAEGVNETVIPATMPLHPGSGFGNRDFLGPMQGIQKQGLQPPYNMMPHGSVAPGMPFNSTRHMGHHGPNGTMAFPAQFTGPMNLGIGYNAMPFGGSYGSMYSNPAPTPFEARMAGVPGSNVGSSVIMPRKVEVVLKTKGGDIIDLKNPKPAQPTTGTTAPASLVTVPQKVTVELKPKPSAEIKLPEQQKSVKVTLIRPKNMAEPKPVPKDVQMEPKPAATIEKPQVVASLAPKPVLLPANVPSQTHMSYLNTFKRTFFPSITYKNDEAKPQIIKGVMVYSKQFLLLMKDLCENTPKELSNDAPKPGMVSSSAGGKNMRSRGGSYNSGSGGQGMARSGSQGSFSGNSGNNAHMNRAATTGGMANGKYRSNVPIQGNTGFQQGNNGQRMYMGNVSPGGTGRGGHFYPQAGGKRSGANRGSNASPPGGFGSSGKDGNWRHTGHVRPSPIQASLTREEAVGKEIRILLNKLTLERFDSISKQLLNVGLDNEDVLSVCIQLIFKKATDEPNFSPMYAQLCQRMIYELPEIQPWVQQTTPAPSGTPSSAAVAASKPAQKKNLFRVLLLTSCQKQFEEGAKWSEKTPLTKPVEEMSQAEKDEYLEKEELRMKEKARNLGNIKFSGELFKLNLIGRQIMLRCIEQLLRDIQNPDEEDIESLCKLLATVGVQLEEDVGKNFMDKYFDRVFALSQNKAKLSSRIRFMCQDLIELRNTGYHTRQQNEGPKTIAEIREEVELEAKLKQEKERQNRSRSGYNKYNHESNTRNSDGWTVQGSSGSGRSGSGGSAGHENYASGKGQPSQLGLRKTVSSSGGATSRPNYLSEDLYLGPPGANTSIASKLNGSGGDGPPKKSNPYELLSMPQSESHTEAFSKKTAENDAGADVSSKESWSTDKVIKRIKGAIAEYLGDNDLEYSQQQITEVTGDFGRDIVETFLNQGCEARGSECHKISRLVVSLCQKGFLKKANVIEALDQFCEIISDLYIDVHNVYKHMAIFLLDFVKSGVLDWGDILKITATIRKNPQNTQSPEALALLGEFFSLANSKYSNVNELLAELKVNEVPDCKVFWSKTENASEKAVQDWAAKYKVSNIFGASPSLDFGSIINSMITDPKATFPELESSFTGTPKFIQEFTSSVLSKIVPAGQSPYTRDEYLKADGIVKRFAPVYAKFIDKSVRGVSDAKWAEKQKLEILLAIQRFAAAQKLIEKCIENWFRIYQDAEIVDTPIYEAWKTDTSRETTSKPEAMKALAKFLKSMG